MPLKVLDSVGAISPVAQAIPESRAAWHASVGGSVELGVGLIGELVDRFVEQVESIVEDFVALRVSWR